MKKWNLAIVLLVWMVILSVGGLACKEWYGLNEEVVIDDAIESLGVDADCEIYVYNNNTINQTGNMSQNGLAYSYNAGILELGVYSAAIECNATNGVDFIGECKFQVGEESNVIIAFVILIPLILSLFLLIFSFSLGKDHDVLRIFLSLLGIGVFFVSFHFGLIAVAEYYGFPELQESIGNTVYWMSWTFVVIVTYFLIYAVWKVLDNVAKKKQEELRY